MIDHLLSFVHKRVEDIGLFALSAGPGSFTGVRIGVSCVKGLAFNNNIPIAPVSTLEALAYNLRTYFDKECDSFIVCPCMDARRNELYNALFEYDGTDFKRLCKDRAISCEELEGELCGYNKTIFLLGDGGRKMYEYMNSVNSNALFFSSPSSICMQNAESVGYLGYKCYLEGNTVDADNLVCTYLRQSQAERNLKEDK